MFAHARGLEELSNGPEPGPLADAVCSALVNGSREGYKEPAMEYKKRHANLGAAKAGCASLNGISVGAGDERTRAPRRASSGRWRRSHLSRRKRSKAASEAWAPPRLVMSAAARRP